MFCYYKGTIFEKNVNLIRLVDFSNDLNKSDIILLGVSRTSKTPTSIYLANRGYKVSNIPIIPNKNLPEKLIESSKKTFVVGLVCDATRLSDVRRNRIQSMHEDRSVNYTNEREILNEIENSKKCEDHLNWIARTG